MSKTYLPQLTVDGGLTNYFQAVWKFPILDRDEEYMLAERFRSHGDSNAAHKLVTSHLRLVAKIAMKFKGYGLPMADLVSEGNIGLMKAVKKFEPERGFRLSTYAMWWIKASITEHILKSWSLVKLGTVASQKKLFFSLRGIKSRLNIMDGGELTNEQADKVAEITGVASHDVKHMNQRLAARDYSLNATVGNEDDGTVEYLDTLVDGGLTPEARLATSEEFSARNSLLQDALAALPDREREIFTERRLSDDPKTLEELGGVYGVSRERIRQLEVRAFDKVKNAILDAAGENAPDLLSALT
ncbi:MAG: RNA polymerase sigma factor RpoH [Rhodospirillales bacterium]|jgi:RNA polymerase sigma-32 factor|nr:RNA polymerase sigma factor RpoH [Rhodospirillales bacterium]MBT4039987.1 RNA polymerase sigma factor RpoH [Rhodospirillales bacterium]MBT4625812.1 RNA polymerase sigma factor RpoH [Rhodospirillales bacterium]MBT5351680.1 RNA polymerase sigma factor RpoH [Rhodospirillales bacterium]MBT5522212.1 RNA polymerase sigma factor RpoH [Rhodospirillales bacterium]